MGAFWLAVLIVVNAEGHGLEFVMGGRSEEVCVQMVKDAQQRPLPNDATLRLVRGCERVTTTRGGR